MERCLKILSGILNIAVETCAKLLWRFEALSNSQWKTIGRAKAVGMAKHQYYWSQEVWEQTDHTPQTNINPM